MMGSGVLCVLTKETNLTSLLQVCHADSWDSGIRLIGMAYMHLQNQGEPSEHPRTVSLASRPSLPDVCHLQY